MIRRILCALILVTPVLTTLTVATQPASAAGVQTAVAAVPGVTSDGVPVSGDICDGDRGGNCYWETAVQFWYDMKQGDNERANLASVYSEYGGNFQDGWTDDNAWWGITWELAYQEYGVVGYDSLAKSLWTWDTTPGEGWDTACGGSTIQHIGGAENDISRAALGVLASSIGNSGSASRAAAWIFQRMQGSNASNPVAEELTPNLQHDRDRRAGRPDRVVEDRAADRRGRPGGTQGAGRGGLPGSAVQRDVQPAL